MARDWTHRLPGAYLAAIGASIVALVAVTYGEGLLRCLHASRRTLGSGSAACSATRGRVFATRLAW